MRSSFMNYSSLLFNIRASSVTSSPTQQLLLPEPEGPYCFTFRRKLVQTRKLDPILTLNLLEVLRHGHLECAGNKDKIPFLESEVVFVQGQEHSKGMAPISALFAPSIGIFHDVLHPLKTLLKERGMASSVLQRRWVCRIFIYWFFQVMKICLPINCPFSHKTVCSQLLNVSPRCVSGKHHLVGG